MRSSRLPDGLTPLGSTFNTDYLLAWPDVVVAVPHPGVKDDAASAAVNLGFQLSYAEKLGRPCGFVLLLGPLLGQDPGARRVYAEGMVPERCFASALVVSNPLSRAIGSFFLGLTRPKVPTKMFDTVEAALSWVREMAEPS